jgi:ribosomal protein L37AE/L43A
MKVVKEIMDSMEPELDKKRIETGAAKPIEDAKCGKCGAKSLYMFPNEVQKCTDCGHSFVMPQEVPDAIPAGTAQAAPTEQTSAPQQTQAAASASDKTAEKKKKGWLRW